MGFLSGSPVRARSAGRKEKKEGWEEGRRKKKGAENNPTTRVETSFDFPPPTNPVPSLISSTFHDSSHPREGMDGEVGRKEKKEGWEEGRRKKKGAENNPTS
jgi:hypothetical protein